MSRLDRDVQRADLPELGFYADQPVITASWLGGVLGCAYRTPTERGDAMFLAMAARACAAIRDHSPIA
ncbi:hypothetical protein HUT06_24030 [Actinomadura sp. NAK00032]|uniref:hypothetical protein n=1 Tax=Actinomadura sp. NAK00032 TaxID=2742128 RepID=UPI0015917287|nr:hypothetical protein [Actinomadura sp. NAK00032]QKW32615.1 hypothetical protein HUT06_24030 [Actinomadura sp. NAK00032]